MKRIQTYFIKIVLPLFILSVVIFACKSPIVDIDPPAEFRIVQLRDTVGNNYQIKVKYSTDSTWVYQRVKADTMKDNSGNPIRDAQNKYIINYDTTYSPGLKKGKYILLDTILLPALEGKYNNLLYVDIESNARWLAPLNKQGRTWFIPEVATGGGDGTASFKVDVAWVNRRSTYKRPDQRDRQPVKQSFFTRDSAVLYEIVVDQKGYREK